MLKKSIWEPFGTSDFPLNQPMVGQKEFYDIFKGFKIKMKTAGMATIFPLIAKWGVGKSRIGFEVIAEALGEDKGWIINDDGEEKTVRIFEKNLEDKVLPIYIRYSQMSHEDLIGDNWVAYGTYTALTYLAKEADSSIQGKIIECIQDSLIPYGFDKDKLRELLELDSVDLEDLVSSKSKLDELTRKSIDYIKQFNIENILIVCDELETAGELLKYGIEKEKENQNRLDSEAIEVITSAIKHEDPRKKYPDVSFLLLCSTVIGGSIQGIGALDRRTEMYEMTHNSFADISDFMKYLKDNKMISEYPKGLVEAAYTIAGGNFGWFNVIMNEVDQRLLDPSVNKETGFIFENILNSSSRFKENLIDKAAFEYIDCEDKYKQIVKHGLLKQIPCKKDFYSQDEVNAMIQAKAEDGEKLFKEFYSVKAKKEELGRFLDEKGYKREFGDVFANSFGGSFDLGVLLRSLKTFSIGVSENEYIIGSDEETFLDQIRMLYPKESIEDHAKYIYEYMIETIEKEDIKCAEYIGPNFAYLSKLDKRYRVEKDNFGYVTDTNENKEIELKIKEIRKNKKGEVKRILTGMCRALELNYNNIEFYPNNNILGSRTNVDGGPYLDVHKDKIVDIIWGKDENKLKERLLDSTLLKNGAHPIIVLSDSIISKDITEKFVKDNYEGIGKCLIFLNIGQVEKDILEVMSLDKEELDIRDNNRKLSTAFRNKIRKINDHIKTASAEWFERVDKEGWVLRPIIYNKNNDKRMDILATAYKTMLIHDADIEELASKKDIKLSDTDYTEFKTLLGKTKIGSVYEKKEYKETGLFKKDNSIGVPSCISKIITFNGDTNKSIANYQDKFFFSIFKEIKPNRIVEQWISFMVGLGLLTKNSDGFIERVSTYQLQGRHSIVKTWLDNDCKKEIQNMKNVINGPYVNVIEGQLMSYGTELEKSNELISKINIKDLEYKSNNIESKLKEILFNIDNINNIHNHIYDKEGWNRYSSYNPNIIKQLKLDDKNEPLWFRIRQIQLFMDYVVSLKNSAVDMINNKIDDIKGTSSYEGYQLPLSPITNMLDRYKNELAYSTDFDGLKNSKAPTMLVYTSSLAYELYMGEYGKAYERLDKILDDCGIDILDTQNLKWTNNGVIGEFNNIFALYKKIVDGYKNSKEAKRWVDYFENAPESTSNFVDLKNLSDYIDTVDMFINGGLDQDIDDRESDLARQPEEFLLLLKKSIKDKEQYIGLIDGTKKNVMNTAREIKNNMYDNNLIIVIDKLRTKQGKNILAINTGEYPKESTLIETQKSIEDSIKQLNIEGNEYFRSSTILKRTTFDFYKKIVEAKGNIDWNAYSEEMNELKEDGLIKIKIEV